MGYTHYWESTKQNSPQDFKKFIGVCQNIFKKGGIDEEFLNIDSTNINANDPNGRAESFDFDIDPSKDHGFCKTIQIGSTFDTAVVACLWAASTMLGYIFESDGDFSELQAGKKLFKRCYKM